MLVGNRFVFGSATFFLLGLAACAVPENTDAPAASMFEHVGRKEVASTLVCTRAGGVRRPKNRLS